MTAPAKPVRLQLSRRKDFRLQIASRAINGLACVKVARPSRWGNPIKIDARTSPKEAVRIFRGLLYRWSQKQIIESIKFTDGKPAPMEGLCLLMWRNGLLKALSDLRGKNLACWCAPGMPCHADVLLELANK